MTLVEHSQAYPLGQTQSEQQRLVDQANGYQPLARALLDQIGVKPGWRAIDIGCGPIGILDLLSERVGSRGRVTGLEREPRFADMARREVARRGLGNVEIVEADAFDNGLEKDAFDLVHERLVLINVAARETFLSEMISLLRPEGTVILEDIDNVSWLCHPAHPSWTVLRDAFFAVYRVNGGDAFIGRRLPDYLRRAGIENIQMKIHVDSAMLGDYRRTHILSLIDSIGEQVIEMGILTETELKDHQDALSIHLHNPGTVVIDKLLVQAWGQKP